VLWVLTRVGERVVQLGIGQTAGVMSVGQGEERRLATGELVEGGSHGLKPVTPP
jgi:hypothetical protein